MAEGFVFKRSLAEVVLERILYVQSTTTIAEAAARLAEGYGALILTDPLRAVTENDIVRALAESADLEQPVEAIGTTRMFLVGQYETPESTLSVLLEHLDRCVIVVDGAHNGLGRLTLTEVMRTLVSCPPWMHALEVALAPNSATLIEVEL